MQTFLNEPDFTLIAQSLDDKRLNKQLLEGRQILKRLLIPNGGWGNHPAVVQWKGYEVVLVHYCESIAIECQSRGIKIDTNLAAIHELEDEFLTDKPWVMPPWWADPIEQHRVITTHRARLFQKDPIFYAHYEQYVEHAQALKCCPACNYYWPVHQAKIDAGLMKPKQLKLVK